ncbi:helix-turn-helix domain-containing protein [Roseobacter sp. HKCCA0434]|uniref:helix-turn-helix domain-containing protein n=1 Tax=Roseobacter sp. HKCCA0434 TaxID=3079297 RepID=UPI002905DEBF|nr:helix-turn-helix domain-containing protein [Roseobacter sp. HKCCA0434]
MDKTEHLPLRHIPMQSLSLRLARSTIRMVHGPRWTIEKVNPVHDLVICLSGSGLYHVGEAREEILLRPGDAMLIPAFTRFTGRHGGGDAPLIGLAQHFSLDLFGRGDVVAEMALSRAVALPDWPQLEPLARLFRDQPPGRALTLSQHHQFMVLLLAYLEVAFLGWQTPTTSPANLDPLSMQIMMVASRLATDPLGGGVQDAHDGVPYNSDYFRRAFKKKIGETPQKFRELKRMEFAASRLAQGMAVKTVAAELGYTDPYFFSRMFKRHMGASPSTFRDRAAGQREMQEAR